MTINLHKKYFSMLIWCILLLFFHFSPSLMLKAQTKYPDFSTEQHISLTHQDTLLYRFLKPLDYDERKQYPLVIFYHGAGERGNDNERTLTHFAHFLVNEEARKNFPCFVLVPQCEEGRRWVEVDWAANTHTQPEQPSISLAMSLELIQTTCKNYSIDTSKIYVTGLSMGGYATWDITTRYPDLFAAAAPICGGGDEATAHRIKNLPLWAFHGDKDGIVKPARSRNMITAIRNAGGSPKYTEYKGVGHDSWKPAYQDQELLKWLFAQSKKQDK